MTQSSGTDKEIELCKYLEMKGLGVLAVSRVLEIVREIESQAERRVIERAKEIVLRNSTEEYSHTAKGFLRANTDKIIFELSKGLPSIFNTRDNGEIR